MTWKRKRYSAEFKAKVALEAIRGEMTVAQLAAKHGVHQTMINAWKKQAVEGMAGVFSGKAEAAETAREGEIDATPSRSLRCSHSDCRATGFRREGRRIWFTCLRRRSQKSRKMWWNEFDALTSRFALPALRITRPWTPRRA